jgi:hypothetical protein
MSELAAWHIFTQRAEEGMSAQTWKGTVIPAVREDSKVQ